VPRGAHAAARRLLQVAGVHGDDIHCIDWNAMDENLLAECMLRRVAPRRTVFCVAPRRAPLQRRTALFCNTRSYDGWRRLQVADLRRPHAQLLQGTAPAPQPNRSAPQRSGSKLPPSTLPEVSLEFPRAVSFQFWVGRHHKRCGSFMGI
jgi:hypothetical protein